MSEQVIRQDIIQLDLQSNDALKAINKINETLDKLKKSLGGVDDEGIEDIGDTAKQSQKKADKLKETIKNLGKTSVTKVNNGLKKMGTHLTNIAKKASGAALRGLKKVAAVSFKTLIGGLVAAGVAVAKFASMASDLEETKNKIDVAFGSGKGEFDGSAKDVMKWSKTSTTAMGLAQQTALDTAALFGDMGTSMGLTKKKAADMSMTLTQQAADLASFKNMSIDEVTTALNGVFTGETESLKRLGVVMTETNLERYAQEKGIRKSLKSMSEAEKVQLRYNYVMEKTKNATGDYKRTGGGFANQLRTLTENFKQLGAIIGKLPMSKLAGAMKIINDDLAQIQTILEDGFQEGDTDKIMKIVNKLLDKGIKALADGIPVILPKILSVLETVFEGLVKALPKIAPVLAKGVVDLMIGLGKIIIKHKDLLVKAARDVITAVVKAIYEGFTGKKMKGDMFTQLENKINNLMPLLKGLAGSFIAVKVGMKGFQAFQKVQGLFGGDKSKGGKEKGKKGGFLKTLSDLAKMKTKEVLKGMANLGIILGGFTALAAILLIVAPLITKFGDMNSFLQVVVAIGVLGIVGSALAQLSSIVGKIQVSTVAKGLANMAIMIGGMSALLLLIGAVALIKLDLGRILKISMVIGVLGVIGAALAVFAGIVGLIPVAVVALGLANMAIIIAGMSALFLLIGACSLLKFDLGKITKIIGIISLLGTVGAILSVFAGIVGMIPIPVVLAGLTNMGLVLGGLTALILAFGKLSEIKGLNEFITKGGKLLVKIFNILGEVVGALIGGVAEGITASLPTIGKNLSNFAKSLKPMFSTFANADMSGIGTFLKSLGSFMVLMAGEKVLSFFTGGTNYAKIGTDLTALAEGATGFFTKVATFPKEGFTNATKLFKCLAGMNKLPNEGGVVGWFSGEVDYTKLSNGLGSLSNEKVIGFFTKIGKLKKNAFEKGKSLFDCLANVKSLPKEGGVAQWFTGTIDYTALANGLGQLAGKKVMGFFTKVAELKKNAFTNAKALFDALAGINSLQKEGGVFQWFTGETSLSDIADDLSYFAENTSTFFTQVNSLNIKKLNGLWNSLKNAKSLTANISDTIGNEIDDIVKKVSDLPTKMGEGIKKAGDSLSTALVDVWKTAVKASAKPVNKLLSGANHILKEFGSKERVISWEPYAKGTNGHKGGNALVNDGRGAELVQMPNGNAFIPKGRNVFIPNAPKGMKVLPADRTAQLMGRKSSTFRYAKGVGDIDVWSYYDNAKGLIDKITENISYDKMSNFAKNVGRSMVSTFTGVMPAWVKKLFNESGQSIGSYVSSKGVMQWLPTVVRALKMEGQYSAANVARTLFQMRTESGGNPRAINLWDSNAKKGIPSKGLMQVIDPTFKAYARAGFDKDVYDPLSNVLASIRYAVSRYGSLAKAYQGKGYANGGIATKPSIFGEKGAEMAIPLSLSKRNRAIGLWAQTGKMLGLSTYTPDSDSGNYTSHNTTEHNTYAPHFEVNFSGNVDERTMARKIKRMVAEAWEEMLTGYESKMPRTQEV